MQESAAELLQFVRSGSDADERLLENEIDLTLLVIGTVEILQAVVGKLASIRGKIVVPFLQGFLESRIGVDFHIGCLTQALQIGLVRLGALDGHGGVRPPGWNHFHAKGMLGDHLVPAQVVGRIIRGADHFHIESADDGLAAEFGRSEFGIALLEDLAGRGRAEQFIYSEHAAEFQMRPVVQRVPHGIGNGFSPFLEGFPGAVFSTGEVLFAYAIGPHRTPFIVVTIMPVHQPELGNVAELDVFGNLLRHQVAVIIDDGHFRCMGVIQRVRRITLQHKMIVNECHFTYFFFL